MKKKEAQDIARERVNLIMEYIMQILSDPHAKAKMNFDSYKINGQKMQTLDIYVPMKNFERHLNLGITSDHQEILFEMFLNKVIEDLFPHETISVSNFESFRGNTIFEGIVIENNNESMIKVDMYGISNELKNKYNMKHKELLNNQTTLKNFRKL